MCLQVNSTSLQKGEEKIRERSRQTTDEVRRRESALLTELRRVSAQRQSAIDAELDRIRYNITRSVINTSPSPPPPGHGQLQTENLQNKQNNLASWIPYWRLGLSLFAWTIQKTIKA